MGGLQVHEVPARWSVTAAEQGQRPLLPCQQPGLAEQAALLWAAKPDCDFLSFCSSDSDSEGDNPEKKKLQEQLMGKRLEP